jgi:hypothetical protein
MALPENEAKRIWKKLQVEIMTGHQEVSTRLIQSTTPEAFYNYLNRHHARTNHFEPERSVKPIPVYGKVIECLLLYVENSRLFFDMAYYPTTAERFGERIAIENDDPCSSHYMERLIQRKNITSLQALKQELTLQRKKIRDARFNELVGQIDVTTDYLLLFPDTIICGYGEKCDDGKHRIIRKTIITQAEFKPQQQEIIDYILNEFETRTCLLATNTLPLTINEAKNVIEDTRKRLAIPVPKSYNHSDKKLTTLALKKQKKKLAEQKSAMIQHYDPVFNSAMERENLI